MYSLTWSVLCIEYNIVSRVLCTVAVAWGVGGRWCYVCCVALLAGQAALWYRQNGSVCKQYTALSSRKKVTRYRMLILCLKVFVLILYVYLPYWIIMNMLMNSDDYFVLEYMWEFLACFFVKVPFMLTFWLLLRVVLFRMLLFMSLPVQYKENGIYTHTCDFQGQYCFSCRRGILLFTVLVKFQLLPCIFILTLAMLFGVLDC